MVSKHGEIDAGPSMDNCVRDSLAGEQHCLFDARFGEPSGPKHIGDESTGGSGACFIPAQTGPGVHTGVRLST